MTACGSDTGENSETENVSTQDQPSTTSITKPNLDAGAATIRLTNPLHQPCIQCPDNPWLLKVPERQAP
jgi:hypothetical protein